MVLKTLSNDSIMLLFFTSSRLPSNLFLNNFGSLTNEKISKSFNFENHAFLSNLTSMKTTLKEEWFGVKIPLVFQKRRRLKNVFFFSNCTAISRNVEN